MLSPYAQALYEHSQDQTFGVTPAAGYEDETIAAVAELVDAGLVNASPISDVRGGYVIEAV
jgi:hypothetical protein